MPIDRKRPKAEWRLWSDDRGKLPFGRRIKVFTSHFAPKAGRRRAGTASRMACSDGGPSAIVRVQIESHAS